MTDKQTYKANELITTLAKLQDKTIYRLGKDIGLGATTLPKRLTRDDMLISTLCECLHALGYDLQAVERASGEAYTIDVQGKRRSER